MKRIFKSRKGFTLIEMVLVIAILVVLAAVLLLGVGTFLDKANNAAASLSIHNSNVDTINSAIGDVIGG
ncbi:MAG: prepilin-type N-terminal cleavage/methylation domain-containing protein [Clostridiales bacterium]|nr:prepilin-type N-terminal cleavage/methylation domain-containing protein [Clostridiales bacterium]